MLGLSPSDTAFPVKPVSLETQDHLDLGREARHSLRGGLEGSV
jgi:hypothetical protein